MINKWINRYKIAYEAQQGLKLKHDARDLMIFVLGGMLVFLGLFGLLTLLKIDNNFTLGFIILQGIIVLTFLLYHMYTHKKIQKNHQTSYDDKVLLSVHVIYILTVSLVSQSLVMLLFYSLAISSVLIWVSSLVSALLCCITVLLTLYLYAYETYIRLFKQIIILVVLFIVSVRFIPLNGMLLYASSFSSALLFSLLIYDVKPSLDEKNPIKLSKHVVYVVTGLAGFLTFAFYFTFYRDYAYQDIQIQPKLNLTYIEDDESHAFYNQRYTLAIEGIYTYIQRDRSILIMEGKKQIERMDLPEDYTLLSSQSGVRIAHLLDTYVIGNTPYYDYDIYQLSEDFSLVKIDTIQTNGTLYGYAQEASFEFYMMPLRIQVYEQHQLVSSEIVVPKTGTDRTHLVYPMMDQTSIQGYVFSTPLGEHYLTPKLYGTTTPWIEVLDDNWLISVSFLEHSDGFLIFDPMTKEIIEAFGHPNNGYDYLETSSHIFVSSQSNFSIYNKQNTQMDLPNVSRTRVMFGNEQIYVSQREITLSATSDQSVHKDTFYTLNMERPVVYGISYVLDPAALIMTLAILFAYVIIDRRENNSYQSITKR